MQDQTVSRQTSQALELSIHVSEERPGAPDKVVADIALRSITKDLFGTLIPYYQLHLGSGKTSLAGPEIPGGRIRAALQRIQNAFHADKAADEHFGQWASRRGQAFFTELLEDFTTAGPGELALLLEEHDNKIDSGIWRLPSLRPALSEQESEREALLKSHQFSALLQGYQRKLLQSARALLDKYGIEASDNLGQIGNLLALHISGQARLLGQFHELQAALGRAQKVATSDSLRRLGDHIDQWHDSVNQLVISTNQIAVPASATLDISHEAPPLDYMRARLALSSSRKGDVRHFRIKADKNGTALINNLQAVGFEIVDQQTEADGKSIRLSIGNPGRQPGRVKREASQVIG